jgi:hypothetical protein
MNITAPTGGRSTVKTYDRPVAAVVTAMTDAEQPFLRDTLLSVFKEPEVGQVIVCVYEAATWTAGEIGDFCQDPRLQIIRLPMMPPGAVRNRAASYVNKDWIAYCDGDDLWCPGKLQAQLRLALETHCDFIGADHYLVNERGRTRAFALARYIPMPSAWLVRTEVMRFHPFNETLYQGEDGEWWIRTTPDIQKVRCPEMLLRYRVRSGSISATTRSKKRKTAIVKLTEFWGIRTIVLMVTASLWFLTRSNHYRWLPSWNRHVPLIAPSAMARKDPTQQTR